MRLSRASTRLPRTIALGAVIALVGVTFALSAGGRHVQAATSLSPGVVSGTGSIVVGTQTITVSVYASDDGVTPPTGSASIETHTTGGPQGSPGLSTVTCTWFSGSNVVVGGVKDGIFPYLLFIADGGPTGASDTLEFTTQPGGPDCTVGPFGGSGGTTLSSGNFTISGGPVDVAPADGIIDTLQPVGTPAGSFYDGSVSPPTSGSIFDAGGLTVSIMDAASPDGVAVGVGSEGEATGAKADLFVCAGAGAGYHVLVAVGSATITCGSVTVKVATGTAEVRLDSGSSVVTIPQGGTAKVTDTGAGRFIVENRGETAVSVTVNGTTTTVTPGETTTAATAVFVGFAQPIDNPTVLNRVKAGQAIPIKWRLVDGAGKPITNLSAASITVATMSCALGTTPDQLEEVAAGASGLQNLGNGYYQLNWKSPSTYAGSCKTLHLLIGGVTHDALFQFTK
jgi:hypothetical protein